MLLKNDKGKKRMEHLLIATGNPAKFADIKAVLKDLPLKILGLSDFDFKNTALENGKNFAENAKIKAKFYCQLSGISAIADDGGLEIEFLNGEPGIKSRRWIDGREAGDEELIEYALKKLKGVPWAKRKAKLKAVACLALPDGKVFCEGAENSGIIALEPSSKRVKGYPFRSLFFLPELNKYYDDLTEEEHKQLNHRRIMIEKLKQIIILNLLC